MLEGGRERLLSVGQVAERLACSTATVYKLVAAGELAHIRITNNAIRVADPDLEAFIARGSGGERP